MTTLLLGFLLYAIVCILHYQPSDKETTIVAPLQAVEEASCTFNHSPVCEAVLDSSIEDGEDGLDEMSIRELKKVAAFYSISKYGSMKKAELIVAIREVIAMPICADATYKLWIDEISR